MHVVRIADDGERREDVLLVTRRPRVDLYRRRPGVATIGRTNEQHIRMAVRVAEDEAGRVGPHEVDGTVARRDRGLQRHPGSIDVPRIAEASWTGVRGAVNGQANIRAPARRELAWLCHRHDRRTRRAGTVECREAD